MSNDNPFSSTIKSYVAKNHKDVADQLEIAELPAQTHAIEMHYGDWPTHKSIAKFIDGVRKEESRMQVQEVWKTLFEDEDNDADDIPVDSDPVEAEVVADAPAEVAVPEIAAEEMPAEEVVGDDEPATEEELAQMAEILDRVEAIDDKLNGIEQQIDAEDVVQESVYNKSDYAAVVNGLIYNLVEATCLDEAEVSDVAGHGYKIAVDDLFTAVVNEEYTPLVWTKLNEDEQTEYAKKVVYFRDTRNQLMSKPTRKMAKLVEREYLKTGALVNTLIMEAEAWPKSVDRVLNNLKSRFKNCISENTATTRVYRSAAYRTAITELGMVSAKCKTQKCQEAIVEAAEGLLGYLSREEKQIGATGRKAAKYISFTEDHKPVDYTQFHQMIESYNALSPTVSANQDKVSIVCEGQSVRNPIAALTMLKESIGRISGFAGISL